MRSALICSILLLTVVISSSGQTSDPNKTQIVTTDIDNFWKAFDDQDTPTDADAINTIYIQAGSPGLKAFLNGRIGSANNLATVINAHPDYYKSIKSSTLKVQDFKVDIIKSFVRFKEIYPKATFPTVYFVIGALNSGGTSSDDGLIIGAEMYGLTDLTPKGELSDWLKTVLRSVDAVPHIVAHELIHFNQTYDGGSLLFACLKEGSADFIAELISGRHINEHVHEFANPIEGQLWAEFQERMNKKDYSGWLYSSSKGRPNDLGYWIGYKICKAYYDKSADKQAAIADILHIKNPNRFLEQSGYPANFK